MEDNLTDALVMAGAVLIFVLALTMSMSSFTKMRSQIDYIIEYDSQLDLVTDEHGNLLNYIKGNSDIREVGIETVVSSMYRIKKENYTIYIAGLNHAGITSTNKPDNVTLTTIEEIELNGDGETYSDQFYDMEKIVDRDDDIIEITINKANYDIDKVLGKGVTNKNKRLYEKLKDKKFKEYIGVYQEKTDDSVDESNKTTNRVITYVIQP